MMMMTTACQSQVRRIPSESIRAGSLCSIRKNEQGVYLLQECRYEDAIECFGTSLRTLNKVLSSHTLDGEPQTVQQGSDDQTMGTADCNDVSQDIEMAPLLCDEKENSVFETATGSQHAGSGSGCTRVHVSSMDRQPQVTDPMPRALLGHIDLIYKKPISMFKFLNMPFFSYNNVVEMSISVMFNFALAHHLFAVSGQSENPDKVVDQAVALYELTHSLQVQERIEISLEYSMGTICNLGHIHQLRGYLDKASKCFQHMLSIFCFLQSQSSLEVGQRYSSDGTHDDQRDNRFSSSSLCLKKILESDVLFQSVSHLLLKTGAAAAA
ncbi:hypothetical protein IV203_031743 [Nitzschia inconspicua]|uniref:Uncharacterized protein n=1 Tax=Nitzschia inconspicua TaxID=303405 RepID=A0A9K3LWB7_9STRA|nr:hypothetical protein IV203_031743 [Nitzschia inconspicua]